MNVTIMAIIMVGVIIASVFLKKIPMQFTLCVVPVICSLLLGYSISDVSGFIMASCNKTMQASGYLVLFALIYFTMLSETGMFNILVSHFFCLFRGKINVYMIIIMTSVIAAIGMLTSSVVTAYLIVFPIMIPLYDQIRFDKRAAMVIAQTSIAAMCFVPWGVAVVNSSVFAGVDAMELSRRLMPVSLCYIPAIVMQWIYFARKHKNNNGIMSISWKAERIDSEMPDEKNEMRRPKLFLVNLLIFVTVIVLLALNIIPAYLVFVAASFITILLDYPEPKDYQKLWTKAGKTFFNTLFMLVGISFFIGVFQETGMVNALATFLVQLFPIALSRYLHIILAAVMVIVIRFMPNKIYNSTYPVLISIGQKFGLSGTDVIAPFVTNMSLATGSSPFTATTHVGTSLLEIDTEDYCNMAVPIQTATNIIIIVTALISGVLF